MDFRKRNGPTRVVLIGIQARTGSSRLPGKVNLPLGNKTILERIADSCTEAAMFLNRNASKYNLFVRVAILCPYGDEIERRYVGNYPVLSFEGSSEENVLDRYDRAMDAVRADYVVRITADCPFVPPYLISRCIKTAVFYEYDYVTNTQIRTFREGMDVEVLSSDLLDWLARTAKAPLDKEHVTTLLTCRDVVPAKFRYCHVLNDQDDSDVKTSVDTQEDYENAVEQVRSLEEKKNEAIRRGDHSA
jgi:spore coat polysaccharide biosynthesis protein SpsF